MPWFFVHRRSIRVLPVWGLFRPAQFIYYTWPCHHQPLYAANILLFHLLELTRIPSTMKFYRISLPALNQMV